MTRFMTKRIYEQAEENDGYRVLVDRLWPRGVSKERAALDDWAKELAPSTELRQWFGHKPERFKEFTERYETELKNNADLPLCLKEWYKHPIVTLLYGARDEANNEAIVLKNYIEHNRLTLS